FLLDDEGHLFVDRVPAGATVYDHVECVIADGASIRADLCGRDIATQWSLVRPTVATTRATLGIASTGRSVRLGDLTGDGGADLCAVEGGALWCAAGDGRGGFASATQLAPLAIDSESLLLGDIDDDRRTDACGGTNGILSCATAASGFTAQPWL